MSLFSRGIRHKLVVAFCLLCVIPLLVMINILVNHTLAQARLTWPLVALVAITASIIILGFVIVRDLIAPIVRISAEARRLAIGTPMERELPATRPDELGELSESMNRLNQRIRGHMSQLKDYGEQVRQLNTEIHQRVLAFSNLLQVSNLISQGVSLDEILNCVMEKLSQIEDADLYALLVPTGESQQLKIQAAHGANPQQIALLRGCVITSAWLTRLMTESQVPIAFDARHRLPQEGRELQRLFELTNALLVPVVSRGRCLALVIVGNRRPQFTFTDEVVETTKVFAKQVAIAIENDLLSKRALALAVTDELTGLYNERYIRVRLEEEVKRAGMHHHPCSFLLVDVDDFGRIQRECGTLASEQVLQQVAQVLLSQVGPVDKVGRLHGNVFGIVLPERTKREAMDLAEILRQRVASMLFPIDHGTLPKALTVSGGVSENPLDGSTAEELVAKATESLRLAKNQGKNRIIAN